MASYELNKTQIAELGIQERIENKQTLNTLAEIAAYTGWSVHKVRIYIKNHGFPATRVEKGQYFSTKSAIDVWLREQHINLVEQHGWDFTRPHKKTGFKKRFHKPHHPRQPVFPYEQVFMRIKKTA